MSEINNTSVVKQPYAIANNLNTRKNMVLRKAKKEDYPLIYKFLSNNYDCDNYYNWDIGRLCFTRFAVNNEFNSRGYEAWIQDFNIWEEDGEIVGMIHTEETNDYFIQVAKEFKRKDKWHQNLKKCI